MEPAWDDVPSRPALVASAWLDHLSGSTPIPQLFPNLNKSLYLARSRKAVIDETAILISLFVEISHGWQAEVGEIVTQFLKVLLAQHLRFSLIGTPSHAGRFYYVRLLFAIFFALSIILKSVSQLSCVCAAFPHDERGIHKVIVATLSLAADT